MLFEPSEQDAQRAVLDLVDVLGSVLAERRRARGGVALQTIASVIASGKTEQRAALSQELNAAGAAVLRIRNPPRPPKEAKPEENKPENFRA